MYVSADNHDNVSNPTPTPATVELWIRSFAPTSAGPTQERALERLEALESSDPIESIEIGVWGKEVEQTAHTAHIPQLQRIETRLEAFEQWAADTGRQLEPFFRNVRVESTITGTSRDVWRLPTVALAEFDADDELVHVAPCRTDERTIDVFDRFDALVAETEQALTTGGDRRRDEVMTDRPSGGATGYGQRRVEPFSPSSD